MQIYSRFYDYYDKMKCHTFCGEDMIFVRKKEEIEVVLEKFKEFRYFRDYIVVPNDDIDHFVIGFCGHYYLCIIKLNDEKGFPNPTFHYKLDDLVDMKYIKESIARNKWLGVGINFRDKSREEITKIANKKFTEKAKKINEQLGQYDLFKEHNTPFC